MGDLATRRATRSTSSTSASSAQLDILVVGCGGGPFETDLSCYLVKPRAAPWADGCIAVEAGSGVGALSQLLLTHAPSFADFELPSADPAANALHILSLIKSYVISHAHLDHIAGLVLSAGTIGSTRAVYGVARTLTNLANVFDGGVWPALASHKESAQTAYVYKAVEPGGPAMPIGAGLAIRLMPVSHGCAAHSAYESSAFFVSPEASDRQLLFFGDVEPDSLSSTPRNRQVWSDAARLFKVGKLSAVMIECSYASDRPDDLLFGHLNPPHLLAELTTFATLVDPTFTPATAAHVARGGKKRSTPVAPLAGLDVYIIHVKRTPGAVEAITKELAQLEVERGLGCHFVIVEQGMRLGASILSRS